MLDWKLAFRSLGLQNAGCEETRMSFKMTVKSISTPESIFGADSPFLSSCVSGGMLEGSPTGEVPREGDAVMVMSPTKGVGMIGRVVDSSYMSGVHIIVSGILEADVSAGDVLCSK